MVVENENLKKFKEFELNSKQKKAIELLVYQGLAQKEVSNRIKVSETTLSTWINHNEAFQKLYDTELENAYKFRQRTYKAKAQKAVEKLDYLMNCGVPQVELNAVKEILDRAGDKPADKVEYSGEVNNPFAGLTTEELQKIGSNYNNDD